MVIDCGLARVPRYEPDVGLTRLETVRVSRAAADQRRGRAGRTEPGVCYRLWDEPQTGSLEPYTRPEILVGRSVVASCSISRTGARAIRPSWPSSIRRRRPRSAEAQGAARRARRHRRGGPHHRRRPHAARACRCRRGSRAWWSMPRRRARASSPPTSPPCSPSAGSAATTSICATGSSSSAATARAAPRTRGAMVKRWADAVLLPPRRGGWRGRRRKPHAASVRAPTSPAAGR